MLDSSATEAATRSLPVFSFLPSCGQVARVGDTGERQPGHLAHLAVEHDGVALAGDGLGDLRAVVVAAHEDVRHLQAADPVDEPLLGASCPTC